MSNILLVKSCRRDETFFNHVPAFKDDLQLSIRIYLNTLDYLMDDGIVIFEPLLLSSCDTL